MLERFTLLRPLPLLASISFAGVAVVSCSGSGTTVNGNGFYGPGGTSPSTLVSECDMICTNVVAGCAGATGLLGTCLSACNDLNLLQGTCLDPFLSYLTCIVGVGSASVSCGSDGTYVLLTPPQCQDERASTLTCNASPGLVAACIALPGNASCGASGNPEFCVGAPAGCSSPSPNPLGIGVYCCPVPR